MTPSVWSYVVGVLPHRVMAYEDPARKDVVYLKWRVAGDWRRKSLGFGVRDDRGRLSKEAVQRAQDAAREQYNRLIGSGVLQAPVLPLSIEQGWKRAIDPERGRWNVETPHRREMQRAMDRAFSVWGASTAWNAIDRGEVRRLWRSELKRQRALKHDGVRSTEIVIARVMSVASWLRDEGLILASACLPWKQMKEEMARDFGEYTPKRLRYTIAEFRAILAASWGVDERWGLLLEIGAEYRLGQVVRVHRRHVDIEAGRVRVAGIGKKRGDVIKLSASQLRALRQVLTTGYLAGLEKAYQSKKIEDYPLFPGLHLPKRDERRYTTARHASREPLDGTQLRKWLRATEECARVDDKPIEHIEGRGWYGLRRAGVDAAKEAGISREGLQRWGSWSDAQTPDRIYADQDADYARDEAARVRDVVRGKAEQNGAYTQNGTAKDGAV